MTAKQGQGQCVVQGHPWEVAPYREAMHRMRLTIITDHGNELVALCSKPQWLTLKDYLVTGELL